MRGDNHTLAVTVTEDEVTGEVKPLFSFPVQICKATESKEEAKIDNAAPSGGSYRTQYVDEVTGEVFEWDDRLRGVRNDETFKAIEPDAIKQIEEATKTKMMVGLGQLPLAEARAKYGERITGSYFVQAPKTGNAAPAYRLLYEGLLPIRKGKKVEREALCLVTMRTARTRQQLMLIYSDEDAGCLKALSVEFAERMREPDPQVLAPQTAAVTEQQIEAVRKVLAGLPDGAEALDTKTDELPPLRQELIDQAVAGKAVKAPTPIAETAETDNLMAALEASLSAR